MRFGRRPGAPGSGFSIRTRMTLAMLIAGALTTPVVLLSLFYIRQMNSAVSRIVNEDIELMHVADRVSLEFAAARRDEKNFLLYRDSSYLRRTDSSLVHINELADTGRVLDPECSHCFDRILEQVAAYRALVDSLAVLPESERTGRVILPDLATLRRHHGNLLRAAGAAESEAERDSLVAAAARLATDITWPLTGARTINDSIVALQEAVAAEADTIAARARTRIQATRRHARTLAAWGQRNIVTVLLLILVVLVWLVVTLPRRAVMPVKRIVNALRRVEEGNLDVRVRLNTRDEIGDLARQLNRVFTRLGEFDERKKNRILHLERRFRLLINDVAEAVIVVDRLPAVVLANNSAEELLGCAAGDATGRKFGSFANLEFLKDELERVLAGSTSRQTCEIRPELPGSAVCIEALRDQAGDVTGAILVITDPHLPSKDEAEDTDPQDRGQLS